MRVCRYRYQEETRVGFYADEIVYPLTSVADFYGESAGTSVLIPESESVIDFLPPEGETYEVARRLFEWLSDNKESVAPKASLATSEIELLVPVPRPNKLFLLAGNYAKHIEEGGGTAAEQADTFPYVFMKPPTTTLTDPGKPIRIPSVSPKFIDWELELAVIIGRRAKAVSASKALDYVAGYTVINDISDRKFRPNPQRKERPRDVFFDWLHGKWHDSFCPCGPCVISAHAVTDPQDLSMELRLNGEVRQDASTAQQIFPVAAVIEFISSFVTLEPGDIISTGTPHGVGNSSGTYLKAGDRLEATIGSIGTLATMVREEGSG
jgi:2-keto-4-pentenoate hydratase/2-oxohepta-3-ene-1,7-dioic acid hydratase in catechol pathway